VSAALAEGLRDCSRRPGLAAPIARPTTALIANVRRLLPARHEQQKVIAPQGLLHRDTEKNSDTAGGDLSKNVSTVDFG
jgi:hypothetical protein